MPDKTISNDQQPAGRWKIRCSAGQDPVTGAYTANPGIATLVVTGTI